MKKIGVVLSGCGVRDGSEIHESVFALLVQGGHQKDALVQFIAGHHIGIDLNGRGNGRVRCRSAKPHP